MNKWKKAFLILVGLDVFIILLIIALLVIPFQESEKLPKNPRQLTSEKPVFTVQADKQQLVKWVNAEIAKHPSGNLSYQVDLSDTLDINGELKVLGINVPFAMSFHPDVDRLGNIVLREKEIKLGRLALPASEVLKFIRAGSGLPKWITVLPDKQEIYVDMNRIVTQDRFYLKAKTMDLPNNRIFFNVYRKD